MLSDERVCNKAPFSVWVNDARAKVIKKFGVAFVAAQHEMKFPEASDHGRGMKNSHALFG